MTEQLLLQEPYELRRLRMFEAAIVAKPAYDSLARTLRAVHPDASWDEIHHMCQNLLKNSPDDLKTGADNYRARHFRDDKKVRY